jgi:competence protein ComEA
LDGIGPVLAARIVAYRSQNGPFLAVEDLLKVSGIGSAKFAQFKDKLRV